MSYTTLLIRADELIVAPDLERRLQRLSSSVPATAISGEEAIELAEQIRPELIFMDIGLIGAMDGIEAAALIRARFSIPIVFLTAYTDANTRQRAESVSPAGFLAKPFADDELLNAIRIALNTGK